MANVIATFKKYIDLLDEVYTSVSLTSKLDSDSTLAKAGANANEIVIPKLEMQGLGVYNRNDGYVGGDATLRNETVKFNYERGRKFNIDAMDNEETAGVAFGKLSAEFIRTKVVPELDAFRFATYAGKTGISKAEADLTTGADVVAAIRAALNKMDEDEVPFENRHLYITPTLKGLIDDLDTTKSRDILNRFASINTVPQTRFYSAIDLLDGKTEGEEVGGYKKDASGKNINFMIIEKTALMQYPKHTVNKIFTPEQNQNADAWVFCYRAYGLAEIYENKTAGVYLHTATT